MSQIASNFVSLWFILFLNIKQWNFYFWRGALFCESQKRMKRSFLCHRRNKLNESISAYMKYDCLTAGLGPPEAVDEIGRINEVPGRAAVEIAVPKSLKSKFLTEPIRTKQKFQEENHVSVSDSLLVIFQLVDVHFVSEARKFQRPSGLNLWSQWGKFPKAFASFYINHAFGIFFGKNFDTK